MINKERLNRKCDETISEISLVLNKKFPVTMDIEQSHESVAGMLVSLSSCLDATLHAAIETNYMSKEIAAEWVETMLGKYRDVKS